MLLARAGNELLRAQPGLEATCPGCDQAVIAKCGDVVIWHWAHRADSLAECDAWTEPETEWHLAWKEAALAHGCRIEVTMRDRGEWHRADIVRPDGVVIEVQHSSLGIGEALEREDFYRSHGGLAWIYDARERYSSCGSKPNGTFTDGSPRYRCHIDAPELHRPVAAA